MPYYLENFELKKKPRNLVHRQHHPPLPKLAMVDLLDFLLLHLDGQTDLEGMTEEIEIEIDHVTMVLDTLEIEIEDIIHHCLHLLHLIVKPEIIHLRPGLDHLCLELVVR